MDCSCQFLLRVMKKQLYDVSDLLRERSLAPPTKKAMLVHDRRNQSIEELFRNPLTRGCYHSHPHHLLTCEGVGSELLELFPTTCEDSTAQPFKEACQRESPERERSADEHAQVTPDTVLPNFEDTLDGVENSCNQASAN